MTDIETGQNIFTLGTYPGPTESINGSRKAGLSAADVKSLHPGGSAVKNTPEASEKEITMHDKTWEKKHLEVFYDGSCALCTRMTDTYRQRLPENRVHFVDICEPGFDPSRYDRTQDEFMKSIHVRDAAGNFHTDIDGIALFCTSFPKSTAHRLVGFALRLPLVGLAARMVYRLFARFRYRIFR